jgi:uncharacterized protein
MDDPGLKTKWFDRWLKGADNGTWPLPGVKYTPYYLGEGSLATSAPARAADDRMPLLPVSSPCSRLTTQWTAGAAAGPCETDNRTFEATALTYTTAPLDTDTQLTGPVVANLYAELTARDATLVAVLSDVGPDGASS